MENANENPPRICNICGSTKFGAGPNGRMAENEMPPRCEGCQSLERHRATREVMVKLREPLNFSRRRALQFSHDRTVEHRWFKSYELSIYDGTTSLDLQKIDRPSSSYDFVICNHVLEHVPDDGKALMEMVRITSERGFVFLTIPAPHRLTTTIEWGYPDEKQHGHYRIYGKDIVKRFERFIPEIILIEIPMRDPVTGVPDIAFLLTRSEVTANQLRTLLEKTK